MYRASATATPPALWPAARAAAARELASVYIAGVSMVLLACLGCTVVRHRRRDAAELRAATLLSAAVPDVAAPARAAAKPPRIRSFCAPQPLAAAPCPICLEPLAQLPVSQGPCRHPLHTACLVQWLGRDPLLTCPVCRGRFDEGRDEEARVDDAALLRRVRIVEGRSLRYADVGSEIGAGESSEADYGHLRFLAGFHSGVEHNSGMATQESVVAQSADDGRLGEGRVSWQSSPDCLVVPESGDSSPHCVTTHVDGVLESGTPRATSHIEVPEDTAPAPALSAP